MTDDRRKKLEDLKRAVGGKIISAADLLKNAPKPRPLPPPPSLPEEPVEEPVADTMGSTLAIGTGSCRRIETDPAEVHNRGGQIVAEFDRVMRGARQRFDELDASPGLCAASDARGEDVLFLRLERSGGAEAPIFLAGMASLRGHDMIIEQFLALEETEEPALLQAIADRLGQASVAVTFDTARSGDVAAFRRRADLHPVSLPDRMPAGLNLRADFRQRYRGQLRSFSLAALEQAFGGRRRKASLDRRAVPEIHRYFIETGDEAPLLRVLKSNREDLLAMVQLLTMLLTGSEPAGE
ncbi:MAG: ribonuclease H-like domain-containing protein [Planctomycetaceae bacterium]|nr:ribonuclease H-like domain-containing protein [Planctomycetaceae bacterium]